MNIKHTLVAAFVVLALAGCSAQEAPATPATEPRAAGSEPVQLPLPEALPVPITVAPAGDSITAGWPGGTTWPNHLGEGIEVVPGFAEGGQKIGYIADNTPACGCDIVVIMAGTNDMSTPRWETPMGERAESLVQIVVQSGARNALILAVPPINIGGEWVDRWNAEQVRLAAYYGWHYFDPWAQFRTAENAWVPGSNLDNAHPNPESQAIAGELIREQILAIVR